MVYGLLGSTLRHSYSPQIHALLGDYEYRLFEVEPQDLEAFLKKREFGGINVTIPYKKDVLPYLSGISDNAKRIGAVNTIIVKEDGGLYGDNTDYDGFSALAARRCRFPPCVPTSARAKSCSFQEAAKTIIKIFPATPTRI